MFKPVQLEKNCIFNSAATTSQGYHKSFFAVSLSSSLHVSNQKGKKKTVPQEHSPHMHHETLMSSCSSGETPSEYKHIHFKQQFFKIFITVIPALKILKNCCLKWMCLYSEGVSPEEHEDMRVS